MKIGIVIVTLNARQDVDACLGGLREVGEAPIYVVDNGSTDGTADYVATHYPDVHLQRLPVNTGFAGGNNAGIIRALADGCEAVFLLNVDTIIDEPFTQACAAVFAANPNVGICGPVVVDAESPATIQCAGGRLNHWLTTFPYLGRGQDFKKTDRLDEVDWILGAALCVHRRVLDACGLLDIEYTPAYVEEVDLCWRAARAGYLTVVTHAARIRHIGQRSAQGRDNETRRMLSHRFVFALKHGNAAQFLVSAGYIAGRALWRKLTGH